MTGMFSWLTMVTIGPNFWLSCDMATRSVSAPNHAWKATKFRADLDLLKGLPSPIPYPDHPNHFLSFAEHNEKCFLRGYPRHFNI